MTKGGEVPALLGMCNKLEEEASKIKIKPGTNAGERMDSNALEIKKEENLWASI